MKETLKEYGKYIIGVAIAIVKIAIIACLINIWKELNLITS